MLWRMCWTEPAVIWCRTGPDIRPADRTCTGTGSEPDRNWQAVHRQFFFTVPEPVVHRQNKAIYVTCCDACAERNRQWFGAEPGPVLGPRPAPVPEQAVNRTGTGRQCTGNFFLLYRNR